MTFYSRRGDDGTTGWLGKGRLSKTDPRIEAVGTLDEASASLGAARAAAGDRRTAAVLLEAQRDLYQLMAEAAASPENAEQFHFGAGRVKWLEQQIRTLGVETATPGEFIVPGDSTAGAALAVAHAVVRRAERRVVELFRKKRIINPALQEYLKSAVLPAVCPGIARKQGSRKDHDHRANRGMRPPP